MPALFFPLFLAFSLKMHYNEYVDSPLSLEESHSLVFESGGRKASAFFFTEQLVLKR